MNPYGCGAKKPDSGFWCTREGCDGLRHGVKGLLFTEAQVREAMVRVAGAFIAAESPAHSLGLYEDVASGRFR